MIEKKVTIFTDGSFSEKASTWGFLIKIQKEKLYIGECPIFFSSAIEAEALSIIKGLEYILKNYKSLKCSDFTIFTDCQSLTSLDYARVSKKPFSLQNEMKKEIIFLYSDIISRGISLKIKHIKAHQKNIKDESIILNGIVDVSVRKLMRNISREIKEKKGDRLKRKLFLFFFKKNEADVWLNNRYWKNLDYMLFSDKALLRLKNSVISMKS